MSWEAETQPTPERNEDSFTQRGSLRPERLVSVRRHQDLRLAGHYFHAIDTLVLICVTVFFIQQITDRALLVLVPVVAGVCCTWFMLLVLDMYRFGRNERFLNHLSRLFLALLAGASATSVCHAVISSQQSQLSDLLLFGLISSAGMLLLHVIWWSLVARWRSKGLLIPNVVVVGANNQAEEFISTTIDRRDMNILGVFDDRADRSPPHMLGVPVLGTTDTMLTHRIMPCVDLIVVTIDQSATQRVQQIMGRLEKLPNPITMYLDDVDANRRADAIEQIADAPLAPLHTKNGSTRKAFAKRMQDLVIGFFALLFFGIPMMLIALVIRLDSPGPVFFRQPREGFNNEQFLVWKFRTLRHETTDMKAERQVTADDDRITRVGRFLRSTSLDELPQLFNVIAGEMSLVGPRPHAIGMKTGGVESSELVALYAHRHRIKPGMTGWAAINGSRGSMHKPEDISMRVAFDIAYIECQSSLLDLKIMAKTIPTMLGDKDAIR